jgi:Sigma-70 region 2
MPNNSEQSKKTYSGHGKTTKEAIANVFKQYQDDQSKNSHTVEKSESGPFVLDTPAYLRMIEATGSRTSKQGLEDSIEYSRMVDRIEPLTSELEFELAKRIRRGGLDSEGAIKKLVQGNLKLVLNEFRNYIGLGLSLMQLIKEGNLGLLKAAENFDYTRGYKFSDHAVWSIRWAISSKLASLPYGQDDFGDGVQYVLMEVLSKYIDVVEQAIKSGSIASKDWEVVKLRFPGLITQPRLREEVALQIDRSLLEIKMGGTGKLHFPGLTTQHIRPREEVASQINKSVLEVKMAEIEVRAGFTHYKTCIGATGKQL